MFHTVDVLKVAGRGGWGKQRIQRVSQPGALEQGPSRQHVGVIVMAGERKGPSSDHFRPYIKADLKSRKL